ncbi:MAG: NADPH-dependent FMN reductase [Candidatus Nanohaloarchaea archaeon]
MKTAILVGTAREGRKTGLVAEAVEEEFSKHHETQVFDLKEREVPTMRKRLSHDENPPEDIEKFSEMIEWCDILTIVTPEYNHSFPGALKNCLDYLYEEYKGKPFSYVTVSAGGFGGVRSQSHLHDVTLALNGRPGPSLQVSNVNDHFSRENVSEQYRDRISSFRQSCEDFI